MELYPTIPTYMKKQITEEYEYATDQANATLIWIFARL